MAIYLRSGLLAALCTLTPLLCVAQQAAPDSAGNQAPVFISFHAPDSTATYPQSINDLMVVTGYYTTSWGAARGFVRSANGTMTTFAVPGAQFTYPVSINHAGEITGTYHVPAPKPSRDDPPFYLDVPQGFVRAADGTITTFGNTPNGLGDSHTTWLVPTAINDAGEVVGNVNNGLGEEAFTRSPSGIIQEFSLGPLDGGATTEPTGMNASGAIIGVAWVDAHGGRGFLWSGKGSLPSPVSDPTTSIIDHGDVWTFPTAINSEGTIVGCSAFTYFERNLEGSITTLDTPREMGCDITVNDAGTIAGSSINEAYVYSGFIIPLHGKYIAFHYPGATNTTTTGLNNLNVITGYYSKGATTEGFILIPGNYEHLE